MGDCGVPPVFSEYMVDCARATAEGVLQQMIQSTFISYGGPDETFARQIYDSLRRRDVTVFFFPESATMGERIDQEVFRQLGKYDRVILICSRSSLGRPGVLHEIRETLDRESRDGGATYLLPIALDNYVFNGWAAIEPELAQRVGRRVVGDFAEARGNPTVYERQLDRLVDALKTRRPD